jgi:hypothetical protein
MTTIGTPDEQTLWLSTQKSGIIHKHVTQTLRITNYAAYIERFQQPTVRVPFSFLTKSVNYFYDSIYNKSIQF